MLGVLILLWSVGACAFGAYFITASVYLYLLEKRIMESREKLMLSCLNVLERVGLRSEAARAESDVFELIPRVFDVFEQNGGEKSDVFELRILKDGFLRALDEYRRAAVSYNDTIGGFPVCFVALILGKREARVC